MFPLKRVLSLFLVLCLGLLVFTGCDTDTKSDPLSIVGTWTSDYGEVYTITESSLSYSFSGIPSFAGTIRYKEYFTSTSGVIIYEYTTPPTYKDWTTYPSGNDPSPVGPLGNFHAQYFKNLTGGSVDIAGAMDDTADAPYGRAEVTTLALAKAKFTLDNVDDFISYWGTFSK